MEQQSHRLPDLRVNQEEPAVSSIWLRLWRLCMVVVWMILCEENTLKAALYQQSPDSPLRAGASKTRMSGIAPDRSGRFDAHITLLNGGTSAGGTPVARDYKDGGNKDGRTHCTDPPPGAPLGAIRLICDHK